MSRRSCARSKDLPHGGGGACPERRMDRAVDWSRGSRSSWRYAGDLQRRGIPREQLTRDDVPLEGSHPPSGDGGLPSSGVAGSSWFAGCRVERMSEQERRSRYWALGLHLGTPVPQNFLSETRWTSGHGRGSQRPETRPTRLAPNRTFIPTAPTSSASCLRPARSGGESRIVSSITVFNEVLRRRPDLAPVLFDDFAWHYLEPQMGARCISSAPSVPSEEAD
jgi:hypothetical protein